MVRLVPLAVACTIDAIPRTGYCPSPRAESGKPWHSTLITSAPISAIMAEATGPATTTDMSMTTTPARGPFAASLMIAPSTNFFRIVPASLYIIYYATSNRIAQRQHTSIQSYGCVIEGGGRGGGRAPPISVFTRLQDKNIVSVVRFVHYNRSTEDNHRPIRRLLPFELAGSNDTTNREYGPGHHRHVSFDAKKGWCE